MFASDRILTLDIGASKLVLAQFSVSKGGEPVLVNYGVGRIDVDPESGTDPSAYVVATIRDLMRERGLKPAPLYMALSGQAVFPRYVKLPPVTRDKVLQIISYEAEQNVPFPIEEVVWDHQLIEDRETGEFNCMLVAVKIENVRRLTDCVQAAGLEPVVVDVAPMALYNSVRFNYPDLAGSAMVLDIGARSSNLIFLEESRIFSRSIPVAGNAITQEIAREFDVPFAEAEQIKLEHAMVALGGVYAGPDSDMADRVSKIVRNVVTRLHAEVNRSINFYRSQQSGHAPRTVLLTGGSSIIPHMDTFFAEKLEVSVEYLNPFANVPVSPHVERERIEGDIHLLAEASGLALRRSLVCPVEINLMPPNIVARQVFRRRQPFFALAAVGVMLIMLCWWVYFQRMESVLGGFVEDVDTRIEELRTQNEQVRRAQEERRQAERRALDLAGLVGRRTRWIELMQGLHGLLLEGMWITAIEPVVSDGTIAEIEFSGRGFLDRLVPLDTAEGSAIDLFARRVAASDWFASARIASQEEKIVRAFTIRAELQEPIELQ